MEKNSLRNLTNKKLGENITWLSVIINIFLSILKCILGIFAHSQALIGDGLHSLSDLITDITALISFKISFKPEDENHHYGHYKFSSLGALFISAFLFLFCIALIVTSIKSLFTGGGELPEWPALAAALISIIFKEWLYWKTKKIAHQLKSRVLLANAWHHRADSFSSLFVLLAIIVAMIGGENWLFMDKVVGLFLGAYLAFQSIKLLYHSSEDLLDKAPEHTMINDIREHILPTPGVIGYHQFRARRIGDLFEVDLHLQVNPNISVEEGHIIASHVKENILQQHAEVLDVLVHIEPANPQHLKEKGIYGLDQKSL
ncbi:MAG: hypothetical protein C5B43_04250 [Verrucomicrobia bacterium]|nr:MAG: hypothetical protein C5B43_04250 [Verrucomicrobiota bacterium]